MAQTLFVAGIELLQKFTRNGVDSSAIFVAFWFVRWNEHDIRVEPRSSTRKAPGRKKKVRHRKDVI